MSSPGTDRNLLFGVLALQLDFLTRDQLVEALHAWMIRKHTPLGEVLCERGILDADTRDAIERLVEQHVKRHGDDPRLSLASVRVGGALRASLAALNDAEVEASLAPATLGPDEQSVTHDVPPLPERGTVRRGPARYRRLRPHAKGGLGEVSVALDEELGREVALKEIQDRFADHHDSRARFVREAEITGHLEHPGIVPVYGLGAFVDGRPYYAMRFIRGESLQDAVRRFHEADGGKRDPGERSLALRGLLERFVAVCNAVAYAHSRGVIHRDLKPANVMLGEYGETLVVDWGLARVLDQAAPDATTAERLVRLSEGGGSGTATELGQAVGTPAYMPPEQAEGRHDAVGPSSDVFALGAILYCVLTGQPPHAGAELQEVLAQAQRGEVVPARRRKADVPRALEAVCARAMAAQPSARYATAKALAEEVERWLADEPVAAYPEPLADRARRWGRRHRSVVTGLVGLLLAGVVGLAVGLWAVRREQVKTAAALDRAVGAEGQALANLRQSEENLKLAREAIDECFNVARDHPEFQGPRMEKARNLLLRKTLRFYRNFRAQKPDDRALRDEEAAQWFRVGIIEQELMRTRDAMEAYGRARSLYVELVDSQPDRPDYRSNLATVHNNLGILWTALGSMENAVAEYQKARDLREDLLERHPEVEDYQNALASSHNNLGTLLHSQGKHEEALAEYRKALERRQKLVKTLPHELRYRGDLEGSHINLGTLLRALGKLNEAAQEFRQARDLLLRPVKDDPDPRYSKELAAAYNALGNTLAERGDAEGALREYRQANELQQGLAGKFPDVPGYRHELALTHNSRGNLLAALGKNKEALAEYRRALELLSQLASAHPDVAWHRDGLAGTRHSLGTLLRDLGKGEEALAEYRRALELRSKLADQPGGAEYQDRLATTRAALAAALAAVGKHEEAHQEYRRARELRQGLVKAHPGVPEYRREQAVLLTSIGALLDARGKGEEALAEYHQARQLLLDLAKAHPRVPGYRSNLATTHNNLGNLLAALDRRDEALREYRKATELQRNLVEAHPDVPGYREDLARTHTNLATLLEKLDRGEGALEEYRQAHGLRLKLARAYPDVFGYAEGLAYTCVNRGAMLLGKRRFRDALADLDEAIAQMDRFRKLDPANQAAVDLLLFGLPRRASALARLGRAAEADADWEWVMKLAPARQRTSFRLRRAASRARAGDYLRATAEAGELGQDEEAPLPVLMELARIHAVSARSALADPARPLPEREKRSEAYAREAMKMLRKVRAAGFFEHREVIPYFKKDPDFVAFHGRDDFRRFLNSLEQ